jgi:uncharacterized protein (TIGR03067 family)
MRVTGMIGVMALALLLAPAGAGEKAKLDPAKLVGTWTFVSGEKDGKKISADDLKKGSVVITKEKITLKSPDGDFFIRYAIDASKSPAQISMEITEGPQGKGARAVGIIGFNDKQLQICYPAMGAKTPETFQTKEGSGLHLFTLARKQ